MKKKSVKTSIESGPSKSISTAEVFYVHFICGLVLTLALLVAHSVYHVNLISNPSQTLFLLWAIESPFLILLYSRYRQNAQQFSYLKAVGCGILGLPAGAVVNALGAIALGTPIGIQYFTKTINWSLMMSSFTIIPAASVFGSSWTDWKRIFAHSRPVATIDYMVCLPAYGAIIGAWFGAWPMPLDWERPWQEWPICVSFGAIAGYLLGMVASFGVVVSDKWLHVKKE